MVIKTRYIAVHLLNDFSGSPRVLADFCAAREIQSQALTLITSGSQGFLSGDLGELRTIWYPRSRFRVLNLVAFVLAQLQIFGLLIVITQRSHRSGESVVVINNTILCWGSLIAARMMGVLSIAYIHELSAGPSFVRQIAQLIIRYTADEVIFVSQFLANRYEFDDRSCTVLRNGLRADFTQAVQLDFAAKFKQRRVLFVGSLRVYKGVEELLKIAWQLPEMPFTAIFSCSDRELQRFLNNRKVPANCDFIASCADIERQYCEAFAVLNLTKSDVCIESFALTVLEGMSCGCPCVVPRVGGHHDYFDHQSGLAVGGHETARIAEFIRQLADNSALWRSCADRALASVESYSAEAYRARVDVFLKALSGQCAKKNINGGRG